MEAVQFHPTGNLPAGILVTEGCRGDGGLLKDVDGHRFMPDYEPEKKELASRDVVSPADGGAHRQGQGREEPLRRASLARHHAAGRKAHQAQPARSLRDLSLLPGRGPTKDWIPVRPAMHYTMGGVRTNHTGESPRLKGLFAAGEAACWDMHGFNRLGGNSVAETVVAGMIVGEYIGDFCDRLDNEVDIPTALVHDFLRREQAKLDALIDGRGTEDASAIKGRCRT
jgi:fumarate reductase flavoprotein subunit